MATPEAIAEQQALVGINADYKEKYGFLDPETGYAFKAPKGLTRGLVEQISEYKNEPQWMRDFRLKALDHFLARPMPTWGSPMLAEVDFDNIHYFVRASEKSSTSWDDVPEDIKKTFDRLGIPEAERKFLSGVGAQYESEVVYHQVREDLEKQGVVFMDMDTGLREHEDLVREYFATIIPPNDNKLAALNSAVWSGGSFVYVPPGVHVEMPLQAYFRINTENMGQFERTLIIADEGSYVHYVEGCTAPVYTTDSLHSAVVELIAKPGARIRYTTVQNWSQNVYNLVTKRAIAETDATVEWVDCNLGSKLTMKYPSVYLMGERAHGEVLSIAFAGNGQHQDAGAKIIHAAPNTTSNIFAKSISKDGGRSSYRGLLEVAKGAPRLEVQGRLRRAADRRALALGHLPDDPHRRGRRQRRPRGLRLEDRRGAALLPAEPRHPRGRGLQDDRQRLHRADRQGAPDGVRGRDEPPDRAPDGGLHWLTSPFASPPGWRRGGRSRLPARRRWTCRSSRASAGWEFTELGSFDLGALRARAPGEGDAGAVERAETLLEAPDGAVTLGQVDGLVVEEPGSSEEGVIVLPLSTAVAQPSRAGRAAPRPDRRRGAGDKFVAGNDAGWTGGAFVYVPRGVRVAAPVLHRDLRRRGRRAAPARAGRARGGRRGRGLGAVPVRLARRRDAAEHVVELVVGQNAAPALRLRPGPQRALVDLRLPARRGRPRRPARLGRRRLRLGARQGAASRRCWPARAPRPRSPAPTRRTRASTSTSTPRRSTARRTRRPTSRSAASSPTARPRSGAG